MLYNTNIKLGKNDKEYSIKLGIRESIKMQKMGIHLTKGTDEIEDMLKILVVGLSHREDQTDELFTRVDGTTMSMEESIDALITEIEESSNTAFLDIGDAINQAIDLGLNKGRTTKESSSSETKNS